ncbi:MAG: alpha/beta fold hydrolase, partial [Alphaproteobacteria bacterium]
GHGRSQGPTLESVEEMGGFLIALADAAGAKTFSLIGHSLGALASLAASSMAPGRVGRLALLGVSSPMRVHPDLLAAAAAGRALARELVVSWGHGRAAHLGGNRAPGMWMLGGGLRLLEAGPAGALGVDLAACNTYAGAEAAATRLACPTLVLCGSADFMTPPKAAAKLASLIKDSRVVTLSGAGHMMMIERPDATLDALKAFFEADRG